MSENKFPADWDEQKVRRVLAFYEQQTEEDALAEDEAGVQPSDTVMNIPHELVPMVRELIAKAPQLGYALTFARKNRTAKYVKPHNVRVRRNPGTMFWRWRLCS
jgi:hypothetical protein